MLAKTLAMTLAKALAKSFVKAPTWPMSSTTPSVLPFYFHNIWPATNCVLDAKFGTIVAAVIAKIIWIILEYLSCNIFNGDHSFCAVGDVHIINLCAHCPIENENMVISGLLTFWVS